MKTKIQKQTQIEEGRKGLQKNATVIIADFTGLSVNEMSLFRKTLKTMDATFKVLKKRLLKLAFQEEGIAFDVKTFVGQAGVVFSPRDLLETAAAAYKFSKQKKEAFKILGGFDVKGKKFIEAADVIRYGQLPSREVLLGQLAGLLTIPIRKFLFVLDQKSKQTVEAKQS